MTDWLDDAYREAERDQICGVEAFKALLREKHEDAIDGCEYKDQLLEAIRVAGDALGTAPELRSVDCVTALAKWCEQLRDELSELRETYIHVALLLQHEPVDVKAALELLKGFGVGKEPSDV
jgi:hypothetical protein